MNEDSTTYPQSSSALSTPDAQKSGKVKKAFQVGSHVLIKGNSGSKGYILISPKSFLSHALPDLSITRGP